MGPNTTARRTRRQLLLLVTGFFLLGLANAAWARASTEPPAESELSALEARVAALEAGFADQGNAIFDLEAAAAKKDQELAQLEAEVTGLHDQITTLEETLEGVNREGPVLRFSGINVAITDGSGTTDCTPNLDCNGLGNLTIGYNESESGQGRRTGSHNLVLGVDNHYLAHSSIVNGRGNAVGNLHLSRGAFSSVLGGTNNLVHGDHGVVLTGNRNIVGSRGTAASVAGGGNNTANGLQSSIGGGSSNFSNGENSSVSGGSRGNAVGRDSSISGGNEGFVSGRSSTVGGGCAVLIITDGTWATGPPNCRF